MLDSKKTAAFISAKRKEIGLTQLQVAEKLNISFQAVSKWENGTTFPNTEILIELADILGVTADEILRGRSADYSGMTYSKAGVDILYTDSIKDDIYKFIESENPRVLNKPHSFASLYDINFPDIENPVLVLKAEEPGSKQKLAVEYGYSESICHDMINHLVNDIIVMGAKPLAVLDTIVCGNAEKDTVRNIIKGVSEACANNECILAGGETSIQPNVVDRGTYILTSSVAGIVDRKNIIDGSKICEGDVILAAASNGLHTNGYSLIRMMMEEMPQIKNEMVGKESFLEAVMKPHTAYYKSLKPILASGKINGMAHITGGGIEGNVRRIIPDGLCAEIDLSKIKVLPLFRYIKANGNISEDEMLKTFNCGVGLTVVVSEENAEFVSSHISKSHTCYEIGRITSGEKKVKFSQSMKL